MPFKLKLKRSKQYNVVSKNLFVISVELLDNTNVECTLLANSIGHECLSNVCQRLGLQQMEYFGLRFKSKQGNLRWVDLECPLKKQLDKYAQEAYLYLGVMFYVADVHLLHDEVTRYHYFLQLKTDIIESRLQCTEDDAILLASYSLQAEFGDHDPERHTTEYLNNFVLLPKRLTLEKEVRDALMERVIHTHRSLQGLSQSLAEVYYIMQAQQLDGYGQECFPAKDSNGTDLLIGASLLGIFVKHPNGQPATYFKWGEIVNLVHQKKFFGMDCHLTERTIQFQMEDSEWAKYVWKMCVLQHRFYSKNCVLPSVSGGQEASLDHGRLLSVNSSSHDGRFHYTNDGGAQDMRLEASQESLDEDGIYSTGRANPEAQQHDHETDRSNLANPISSASDLLRERANSYPQQGHSSSELDHDLYLHQQHQQHLASEMAQAHLTPAPHPVMQHPSETDLQMMLQGHASIQQQQNLSDIRFAVPQKDVLSLETRKALLPHYRQAPDYETAVRHKYGEAQCSEMPMSGGDGGMGAQCGLHPQALPPLPPQHLQVHQSYAHYKNFTDLSSIDVGGNNEVVLVGADGTHLPADTHLNPRVFSRTVAASGLLPPPMHTYSTPELATVAAAAAIPPVSHGMTDAVSDQALARIHPHHMLNYQYKPPPPYPYNQRSSSSTPDLTTSATHPHAHLAGNFSADGMPRVDPPGPISQLGSEPSLYPAPHYVQQVVPHREQHQAATYVNAPHHPLTSIVEASQGHDRRNPSPPIYSNLPVLSEMQQGAMSALLAHHQGEQTHRGVQDAEDDDGQQHLMGPMLVAAMNGLTLSRPDVVLADKEESARNPRDARVRALESKLSDGQVFLEFEQIPKKKASADFTTSLLPENAPLNRFKDVLPYEENRVRLTPTKDNRTGYINASHITASVGTLQKFYIATQGPMANTVQSFWQMVWEQHVQLIVMLTNFQEQGKEKCYPYWPQDTKNGSSVQFGEFQVMRNYSMTSATYVTTSLTVHHSPSRMQRSIWHIRYTDWPEHGCPADLHGFLSFMEEIDAVKRLAQTENPPHSRAQNCPVVVHCSAGVGRSGVVILCDILLYSLDHNEAIDVPKVLLQLRLQRMLTVQTLAQYKFVYAVLAQHLTNSRLI